jgi:hypothetical protein
MEIAGLVDAEQLFELDVKHPKTDKPVGVKIMLRSAGSDAAMAVVRRQTDEMLVKQQRRKPVVAETIEDNEIEQAASYVASWDWGTNTYDGVKPSADAETVKAILRKEPWLYAQIVTAARDIANFTKG